MVTTVEKKDGLRKAPVCSTNYSGTAAVVTTGPQNYGSVCLKEDRRNTSSQMIRPLFKFTLQTY